MTLKQSRCRACGLSTLCRKFFKSVINTWWEQHIFIFPRMNLNLVERNTWCSLVYSMIWHRFRFSWNYQLIIITFPVINQGDCNCWLKTLFVILYYMWFVASWDAKTHSWKTVTGWIFSHIIVLCCFKCTLIMFGVRHEWNLFLIICFRFLLQ